MPPHPQQDRKRSRRLRWTSGITAAALLGAGGTIIGLTLAGPGGAPGNAAQAVALSSALSGVSNCPARSGGGTSGGKSSSSGKNSSGAAKNSSKKGCLRLRLRRVKGMYGQIAYHTSGGTQTLAFERGRVVSFSGGTLVIKAGSGTEWTWNVASSSIVRESGKPVSSTLLTPGVSVFVGGQVVGSSKDAKLVVIHKKKSGQNSSGASSSSNSSSGSPT